MRYNCILTVLCSECCPSLSGNDRTGRGYRSSVHRLDCIHTAQQLSCSSGPLVSTEIQRDDHTTTVQWSKSKFNVTVQASTAGPLLTPLHGKRKSSLPGQPGGLFISCSQYIFLVMFDFQWCCNFSFFFFFPQILSADTVYYHWQEWWWSLANQERQKT